MTASETDDIEHGTEAAAQDFEQPFGGMPSADFGEVGKGDGFTGIMPSAAEEAESMGGERVEVDNSALIAGLPVMMKVVLGSAKMPVATLSKLAKGSVVKLDKMVGDPVDILVNGHLIARGEVVVLNEASSRFGVVLTQVGKLTPAGK
jgi:flagellar motor switch protein FliN/FliY